MTPEELKQLRESFDFTQKQMALILGIHPNALQNMEYGKNNIPKYIRNYSMALTVLNESYPCLAISKDHPFLKHIKLIGVEL